MHTLIIFYDSHCPLCSLEMQKLKSRDTQDLIQLEDLHQNNFTQRFPDIDVESAMAVLHGMYQGERLLALDVTHRAWTLVGKGKWVAPLGYPIIKPIAHWIYLFFARYRQPISHFISRYMGIKHCPKGVCHAQAKHTDHRSQ